MEFFKSNIKDTNTLDLTLSSSLKLFTSRFLQHPFVSGFSNAISSVGLTSADLLNKIKPYRFVGTNEQSIHSGNTQSPKLKGQGSVPFVQTRSQAQATPSIQQSTPAHNHKGDISAGFIKGNPVVGQQPGDVSHETKGKQTKEITDPQDLRTTESSRKLAGTNRQRLDDQVSQSKDAEEITGLKFSHSRLEGTDIAIDVALLASGMGGVLLLEHIADMAIHTRLKKESTLRGDRLASGSDRPGTSIEKNLEGRMQAFTNQQKNMQENKSMGVIPSPESSFKPSVTRMKR
jgi:hypothetical protein